MKALLQNLKDRISKVFPLHLNRTVTELEERLAEAEFGLSCTRNWNEMLRAKADELTATNNAYRRENTYLMGLIKALQKELEAEFNKGLPMVLPVAVRGRMDATYGRGAIPTLDLQLPEMRIRMAVAGGTVTPLYAAHLAGYMGRQVQGAVVQKVKEILSNEICKGN